MEVYKINNVPCTVYYIPDFITEAEETEIIEKVNSAPKPKWTQLSNRRLQNWGGVPHPNGMIAEAIPQWLKKYMEKIDNLGLFNKEIKSNHVLVNEYTSGQGIMPHLDGPLFYPTVTTISCGSHTVLDFYEPSNFSSIINAENGTDDSEVTNLSRNKKCSLLLQRRSLLVLQDDMYNRYLHGIAENEADIITEDISNLKQAGDKFSVGSELIRGTRISLTIRHVPKTSKLKLRF